MTVKDVKKCFAHRSVMYQLVGAHTGRILAKSWKNKADYLSQYDDCESSGMFPVLVMNDSDKASYSIYARPVINIWVSGK